MFEKKQAEKFGVVAKYKVKPGDIVWVHFGDTDDEERSAGLTMGVRPALIVAQVSDNSPMLTVIPMTTSKSKMNSGSFMSEFHIKAYKEETGLEKDGVIIVEQMTSISKKQITYVDTNTYVDWDSKSELKKEVISSVAKLLLK